MVRSSSLYEALACDVLANLLYECAAVLFNSKICSYLWTCCHLSISVSSSDVSILRKALMRQRVDIRAWQKARSDSFLQFCSYSAASFALTDVVHLLWHDETPNRHKIIIQTVGCTDLRRNVSHGRDSDCLFCIFCVDKKRQWKLLLVSCKHFFHLIRAGCQFY